MKIFLSIMLVLSSNLSLANIRVKNIKMHGQLCSSDNTVISLSEDGQTFTALFSEFFLEADSTKEKGSCRLSWQLEGVRGYKIMNLSSYLRAYSSLSERDSLNIRMLSKIDRVKYAELHHKKRGPEDDDFLLELRSPKGKWSRCIYRDRVNLELSNSFKIIDRDNNGAYVNTDSIDHRAEFQSEFIYKPCRAKKSFLMRCSLEIETRRSTRTVNIFAHAKSRKLALEKIRRKHRRKCQKLGSRKKCKKFRRNLCRIEKV